MKMLRRQLLCLVVLALLYDLCVWREYHPELPSWLVLDQPYDFAALTPRQHYGFAMSLWSQQTPSRNDLEEAIRHLEAIHEDSPDSDVGKRLALIRLQLDRPAEYQATMHAAQVRYASCAAQVQAEALAESAKRGKPCPARNLDGTCYVPMCGNYIQQRCWDGSLP